LLDAWQWAAGNFPLPWPGADRLDDADERVNAFRRENRPHAPAERYFDKTELRKHPELIRQAAALVRAARQEGVSLALLADFVEFAAMTAVNGETGQPSPTTAGEPMTEPATTTPEPQPVAAAIVTSTRGVLAGRRNDGKPPWTFIAGEVEPGEIAPFAAVREVKEEAGLEVRAGREIGRRVHPKTGRTMIYIAAEPVRPDDLDVFVGDTDELAEVRWLSLAEADELLPGMFEPVRDFLERALPGN
jgi:8-oxo-dGTP pyrophosphatase MutT (NUDIX family)